MNALDNLCHQGHDEIEDCDALLAILAMPLDGSPPAPVARPVVVRLQAALDAKRWATARALAALRSLTAGVSSRCWLPWDVNR